MRPDTATARRWVLVSMVLLLIMAAYKNATSDKAGGAGLFKRLWGVGVLGLILSMAADFVPQLAGPFALLVVLGYATQGGDKAIQNVLGKVSGSGGGTTGLQTVHVVNVPGGTVPTHPGANP